MAYEEIKYVRKMSKKNVDDITSTSPRNSVSCHHCQVIDNRLGVEGKAIPKCTVEGIQQIENMWRRRSNKMAVLMGRRSDIRRKRVGRSNIGQRVIGNRNSV